jgi:hypothetical protein
MPVEHTLYKSGIWYFKHITDVNVHLLHSTARNLIVLQTSHVTGIKCVSLRADEKRHVLKTTCLV